MTNYSHPAPLSQEKEKRMLRIWVRVAREFCAETSTRNFVSFAFFTAAVAIASERGRTESFGMNPHALPLKEMVLVPRALIISPGISVELLRRNRAGTASALMRTLVSSLSMRACQHGLIAKDEAFISDDDPSSPSPSLPDAFAAAIERRRAAAISGPSS